LAASKSSQQVQSKALSQSFSSSAGSKYRCVEVILELESSSAILPPAVSLVYLGSPMLSLQSFTTRRNLSRLASHSSQGMLDCKQEGSLKYSRDREYLHFYVKKVRAATTSASTPVAIVGCTTGAKYALWSIVIWSFFPALINSSYIFASVPPKFQ